MPNNVVSSFGLSQPAFLAPRLAEAVAMLNAAGFCVVAKNRMAEVVIDAGVQEPPAGTPEDKRNAHWSSVFARMSIGLSQEIVRQRLYVTSMAPMAGKPGFIECKIASVIVTPPGASMPVAARRKMGGP